MGNVPNQNHKAKPKKVSKMQVEIACIKVKAHLQLVKDRKVNELMKDEKALVAMLNAKSRNKIEEVLQAEKVISDLKYIQVCTTLMAYANTLKNNCAVIAQSQGNTMGLQELTPYIISIIYAASHLGLSSLNEFKALMLNFFGTENVQLPIDQVDPKIVQAFKVNSTPLELNTYFIEMSERNNIPLESINTIGHNITRHYTGPLPNNPQINPHQNNRSQQQQIYGGNPYINTVNFEAPNVPNKNFNPPGGNFNYPTEEYNPFDNKGFEFGMKPINPPAYNPNPTNQINNEIAKGFSFNPPASIKPTTPPAFVPPPKLLQNDPYANLLNINQIDDIPLYPQMERLSVDPNKNKNRNTPMGDTVTPNMPYVPAVSPGGFSADYNPSNYLPQYVPFKPDYEPSKNVESRVYPDANFKDQAKLNQNTQGFNPTPENNPYDNFNPYTGLNDPGFDQICEQIKKGL